MNGVKLMIVPRIELITLPIRESYICLKLSRFAFSYGIKPMGNVSPHRPLVVQNVLWVGSQIVKVKALRSTLFFQTTCKAKMFCEESGTIHTDGLSGRFMINFITALNPRSTT